MSHIEFTPMNVPVGATPTVDEALLERVAVDPDWVSRVLVAAARALNTLDFYDRNPEAQSRDFSTPGAESYPARETLRHAFTDWNAVLDALRLTPVPNRRGR